MKKRIIYASLALLAVTQAQAQGVFSTAELNRSASAVAMGGLNAATGASAYSVFENASAVSFSEKKGEVGVMYSPWAMNQTDGMDRNNMLLDVAGYWKYNEKSSFLMGISYYKPGGNKMFETDADGNVTGDEIKQRYISVDFGYAYKLMDNLSLSATARYVNWDTGLQQKVEAVSFDIAATQRFNTENFGNVDVTLKAANWGKTISGDTKKNHEMPGSLALGGLWNYPVKEKHDLKIGAEAGYRLQDENVLRASVGAEYGFNKMAFVRAGYYYTDLEENNSFASFGVGGCFWNRLKVDATYLYGGSDSPVNNTIMVGVSTSF